MSTKTKVGRPKAPRKPREAELVRARFKALAEAGRFTSVTPKTFRELNNRGAREAVARKGRTT